MTEALCSLYGEALAEGGSVSFVFGKTALADD
jgi:hypothetical protein